MMDVRTQLSLGVINTALVLEFDERVESWDNVLRWIGEQTCNIAKATILER